MRESLRLSSTLLVPFLAAAPAAAELPTQIEPQAAAASLRLSHGLAAQPDGTWKGGGADYRARFDGQGFVYEPALGAGVATTQRVATRLSAVERGGSALALGAVRSVAQAGTTLVYDHGAIDERFAVGAHGVELAYVFEQPLPGQGDLVVRLALGTTLPLASADAASGLRFARAEGGVSIGGVTGIDADGDTVAGTLELGTTAAGDSELLLRLPAAFVDAASYPLVLDPLVGTSFGVATSGNDDTNPDAAFDATNDAYLVVWQRTFSAADSDIRGQRVSSAGALVGSAIFFNSAGVAVNPQVANVNRKNVWSVVYEQVATILSQTQSTIELEVVDAASGAITFTTRVASEIITDTTPVLLDPDVGGEGGSDPLFLGPNDDFTIVYNDEIADQIVMRHAWFDGGGTYHQSAATPLFSDSQATFTSYSEPRIARSAGVYGRLLVAVRRTTLLSTSSSVRGLMVDVDGNAYFPAVPLSNSSLTSIGEIDIDGFDRRFVAAWQGADTNGNTRIQICSIDANISTGQLTVKQTVDATTPALFVNQIKPGVGYSSGKTWIGYRESNSLLGSSSFKVKGFDSGSCVACEGALTLDAGTFAANEFIAVATPTSGGAYYDDRGLAVWSVTGLGGDINAQLLKNNAQLGSTQDLGGGCGTGGTVGFAGAPSIGSSWFYPYVTGLPAGTAACFVNFAFGQPSGIACGSCVWIPFQIAYSQPIQGGNVTAPVVIPCDPNLIGAPVDVQFTSVTPLAAPCPQFPGFSLSNRWRMTIGQ